MYFLCYQKIIPRTGPEGPRYGFCVTEKKRGRPATGQTPHRGVRVSDEVWKKATEKAAKEGRSVSDVVRECLDKYTDDE